MNNQAHALVFPLTSYDLHLCLLKVLAPTLKVVKYITEHFSTEETPKVVPDQFKYIDEKTGVNYMKDRDTS